MNKIFKIYLGGTLTAYGMLQSALSPLSAVAIQPKSILTSDGSTPGDFAAPAGFADNMGSFINGVLSFVMVIAALLVLFYLIWGGIEWITSGGDKGKTESARNKITAAVIGIIILAASFAILQLVLTFLGFTNLNDALQFKTL
jgi:hypothetical protein